MGQCKTVAKEGEDIESLIKRFSRSVMRAEILDECKRRQFFINNATKRKEKSKRAKIKAIKASKAR